MDDNVAMDTLRQYCLPPKTPYKDMNNHPIISLMRGSCSLELWIELAEAGTELLEFEAKILDSLRNEPGENENPEGKPPAEIFAEEPEPGTIYIAGPMRGIPEFNFPAFDTAKEKLESEGWVVVSPADMDRTIFGFEGLGTTGNEEIPQELLRQIATSDITALSICDAIYLLEGWSASKGVVAELAFAKWLELDVLFAPGAEGGAEGHETPSEDEAIDITLETDMAIKAAKLALENLRTFDRKQKAYGSGNIAKFGEKGVLVRVSDKFERLKNLLEKGGDDPETTESVLDSWLDLSNYGLIGALCRKGEWR